MGERDVTAPVKAELSKGVVYPALFVEMLFDGGTLRLWSGYGDRLFGGSDDSSEIVEATTKANPHTFTGSGTMGTISAIQENAGDVRAAGVQLSLSGIPSDMLALTLTDTEPVQGRPCTIWIAFFDPNWVLIADAVKLNGYQMDYSTIDEGGDTCKITVFAESILADLERPRVRRYTHEDQQALYPGDRGLEYVAGIQNKEFTWNSK